MNESGAIGIPKNEAVLVPAASAALRARLAKYGPKNTVPTVVLNAELAQSYIAQPKISRLSFGCGVAIAVAPAMGILLYHTSFVQTGAVLRSTRSEEHTSELQSPTNLVCRLLLEK